MSQNAQFLLDLFKDENELYKLKHEIHKFLIQFPFSEFVDNFSNIQNQLNDLFKEKFKIQDVEIKKEFSEDLITIKFFFLWNEIGRSFNFLIKEKV